jgi:hypothetical protein
MKERAPRTNYVRLKLLALRAYYASVECGLRAGLLNAGPTSTLLHLRSVIGQRIFDRPVLTGAV